MFLDTKPYRLALFVALFYLVTSPPPQIFNMLAILIIRSRRTLFCNAAKIHFFSLFFVTTTLVAATFPLRKTKIFYHILKILLLWVNWQWDCETSPEKMFLNIPVHRAGSMFWKMSDFTKAGKKFIELFSRRECY